MKRNLTPKQFRYQAESLARNLSATVTDAVMLSALAAEEHFDSSFDNEGFTNYKKVDKWKSLATTTVRRKGHDRILHNTGKLRKSQKRLMVSSGGRQGARVKYAAPYAHLQNNGFVNKDGKQIVARKFIGGSSYLNRKTKNIITERLRIHFTTRYYIGR